MTRIARTAVFVCCLLAGCQPADTGRPSDAGTEEATEGTAEPVAEPYVVDIVARDYAFVGPAEVASGWVTFRLINEGMEHHFMLLNRLPDDRTPDDYVAEVAAPFGTVWQQLLTGEIDRAEAGALLGELIPAWYGEVKQMGGPGLVAPGGVARATSELEPGTYMIECYVKTAEGEFHAALGMARPLTVTDEPSGAAAPEATIDITLTNAGMQVEGTPTAGEQVVAVHFEEHPAAGLGNDVHVVRLDDGIGVEDVVPWMDWMNVDGLRAPSPAAFVGGTQEAPVGSTAFFTVTLEPGRYAWIAESAAAATLVEEFSVP